jgi:hypothetical protein
MAMVNSTEADVIDTLAHLFEERLGGMMLVRLGLTELVEHFKQEEHALAKSLKTILQLRDEERKAYRAQLDSAAAYARQLEAQLQEARHIAARRVEDAMAPLPPGAAVALSGQVLLPALKALRQILYRVEYRCPPSPDQAMLGPSIRYPTYHKAAAQVRDPLAEAAEYR